MCSRVILVKLYINTSIDNMHNPHKYLDFVVVRRFDIYGKTNKILHE